MGSDHLLYILRVRGPQIIEISLLCFFFLAPWALRTGVRVLPLVLGFIVWLLEGYFVKRNDFLKFRFLDKYILLYVFVICISAFFSQNIQISIAALRKDLLVFLLVYILAVRVNKEPEACRRLFFGLSISSAIITVYGIGGYFFQWEGVIESGGKALGPFPQHNILGQYLAVHILFVLALYLKEKSNLVRVTSAVLISFQVFLLLIFISFRQS